MRRDGDSLTRGMSEGPEGESQSHAPAVNEIIRGWQAGSPLATTSITSGKRTISRKLYCYCIEGWRWSLNCLLPTAGDPQKQPISHNSLSLVLFSIDWFGTKSTQLWIIQNPNKYWIEVIFVFILRWIKLWINHLLLQTNTIIKSTHRVYLIIQFHNIAKYLQFWQLVVGRNISTGILSLSSVLWSHYI